MKMKKFILGLVLLATAVSPALAQQYKYTEVAGDPMHTRIYTLNNGLKVYLSVNKEQPRLQANIAVKTGSRNDPHETTGLAHYLEHLMFKGTTHFGSSDVQAEAPLLADIERRFEAYRKLTDKAARKKAYHEIDSVSQLAARYNIPNEYDKMMASIGSEGSNAYTSNDVTCYIENIPNNEIETWARIQADRFQNMVIRGFHTELESVYEEYNIGLASDGEKEWVALMKKLFPGHPYGTQTTIGTQDHLKNPSITNIKNYFRRYYVPNNVAICLAGDFDPDKTIAIIDKYFGQWQSSPTLSRPEYAPVPVLTASVDTTVVGQEAENVLMGWKTPGANTLAADTLNMIASLLSNGTAGLMDLDLNQPMKVQYASAGVELMHDYGMFIAEGMPRQGQTLEDVRKLILAEIDKLKKGDFDESLLTGVVTNLRLQYNKGLLSNQNRASQCVDAFINDEPWEQQVKTIDRMAAITKQQIVAFANRFFLDNCVTVYKRQGNDTTIHKIEKPEITPIPTNNDKHSAFLDEVVNMKPEPIQPVFVDYNKDMVKATTKQGLTLLYKHNDQDDLFDLAFRYPFGETADTRYNYAAEYLSYVGTDKMSNADFKKQAFALGCSYNFYVDDDAVTLHISGLNSNLSKSLALVENLIKNAKGDKDSWNKYVEAVVKSRKDNKTNQRANFGALRQLGQYGKWSRQLNVMTEQQLRDADPQQMLALLPALDHYQHMVLYFGASSQKELEALVAKEHKTPKKFTAAPSARPYVEESTPKNEVWIAPYKAQNIYMTMYHNEGTKWEPSRAAIEALFNEYFGGGMNAIVFQELREARGLAYSAGAAYLRPNDVKAGSEGFTTTIISQNDKMMDCIREFNALLDSMPRREAGFRLAEQSLMKQIATMRTTRFNVLNSYIRAQKLGIDYDLNSRIYRELPSLTLQDLVDFATQSIAKKTYRYLILGDESQLDTKTLEKIAPIRRVSTEEIFGY